MNFLNDQNHDHEAHDEDAIKTSGIVQVGPINNRSNKNILLSKQETAKKQHVLCHEPND